LEAKEKSLLRTSPTPEERLTIHGIFLQGINSMVPLGWNSVGGLSPVDVRKNSVENPQEIFERISMKETQTSSLILCQPSVKKLIKKKIHCFIF
jgi:hypothetical protein